MNKTLSDMKRADHSFAQITHFKNSNGNNGEMKSYIKKMPMLIKTNGIGQTFAFYLSKGSKDTHRAVLNCFVSYFADTKILETANAEDLIKSVISLDQNQYRMMTKETMNYLNWLRRFAEGLLKGD